MARRPGRRPAPRRPWRKAEPRLHGQRGADARVGPRREHTRCSASSTAPCCDRCRTPCHRPYRRITGVGRRIGHVAVEPLDAPARRAAQPRRLDDASDADIVGSCVDLDGEPHAVVGVLPQEFGFPNPDNEFWTPLVIPPFVPPSADDPAEPRMTVRLVFGGLGRLRGGVSPEQAATEARTILQANAAASRRGRARTRLPGTDPRSPSAWCRLLEEMVGEYRPVLLVADRGHRASRAA